jgi:predicted DNA-binding protein with PD1-like motif
MGATLPWSQTMQTCPLRLAPGDDLRVALEQSLAHLNVQAAFVLQGIGSLSCAQLRFAGLDEPTRFTGDYEILTLGGSLSPDGAHLHMSIADALGNVCGGHVAPGCIVRTTAEVLVALLPAHAFSRQLDAQTGFAELVIAPAAQQQRQTESPEPPASR